MFVSDDGTVTGSIDVSKLDEIEPKTDEARAQLDALKAERDAGQAQAAADAERVAEQPKAEAPAEAPKNDSGQQSEVEALQAEAEAAGVTVDKRWGADRLRQEIDAAKAAKTTGRR